MQNICKALRSIISVGLLFFAASASAEMKQISAFPPFGDYVVDAQPDGFVHAFEKGLFHQRIVEYIPEGESLDSWTRMLSVAVRGRAEKSLSPDQYSQRFFELFKRSCKDLTTDTISKTDKDLLIRVDCRVRSGVEIPGGKGLKWEKGIYRFVKTAEAFYVNHYVAHGKKKLSKKKEARLYEDARKAIDDIVICELRVSEPCPGLDLYALDMQLQVLRGAPPCRTNNAISCKPTAIMKARTAPRLKPNDDIKKIFLTVDFQKENLYEIQAINRIAGTILQELKKGAPEFFLVIRGPNPDYLVTSDDRVQAGTFMNALRSVLIAKNSIDVNSLTVGFTNFH